MEADYNLKTFGERFQVLLLYLVKIIDKSVMVCTSRADSLETALLVFQKHFECQ